MEPEDAPHDLGSSAPSEHEAPLNGTLEDYSPAGVLQVLSSQRETGAVRFSGEAGCTVYLHDGQLYFAETASTGEALAVALVRPERLTPDEWDDATQAGYPSSEVGQELLRTGAIDRELLASVVLSIIYDPLIHLFRQGEGAFEFEPGTIHWMGPFRTFDLEAIVAEVRRRVREADEMAELIPDLGVYVTSAPTLPHDRGSVNLRRDDWEVAIAAASGCRIQDLAVELGRGQWSTARLVYRLASAGLLEISEGPTEVREPAERYDTPTSTTDEPVVRHGLADAFADTPHTEDEVVDLGQEATDWATPPPLEATSDWGSDDPSDDTWGSPDDVWDASSHGNAIDAANENHTAAAWPDQVDTAPTADTWAEAPSDATTAWASPEADTAAPWADPDADTAAPWADPGADPATATGWADTPTDATAAWATADATGTESGTTDWAAAGDGWEPEGWSDDIVEAPADTPSDAADEAPATSSDHGITFDMPNLHPDIAKALADSTYADSATAINAMAARLGAAAADDDGDDDWENEAAGADAEFGGQAWPDSADGQDLPWAADEAVPAAAGGEGELSWAPSSWETGVEAIPLPHRDRSFADEPGPAGPADPEWLENLYAEFMSHPEEGAKRKAREANPVEAAFTASPEVTATKNRTLRRVISAIRRL